LNIKAADFHTPVSGSLVPFCDPLDKGLRAACQHRVTVVAVVTNPRFTVMMTHDFGLKLVGLVKLFIK
jgi:hypothetical protein